MNDKERKIWVNIVENIIEENEPWDSLNKSERYHVTLNTVKIPPKIVLARAIDIIQKKHPEIEFKKIGGGVPTNQFLENLALGSPRIWFIILQTMKSFETILKSVFKIERYFKISYTLVLLC